MAAVMQAVLHGAFHGVVKNVRAQFVTRQDILAQRRGYPPVHLLRHFLAQFASFQQWFPVYGFLFGKIDQARE